MASMAPSTCRSRIAGGAIDEPLWVTRIVSSRRGIRASVATVALVGGAASVETASSIQWEQPVPRPSVMARTLLINGREKIRPIILRTPGLEEEGKPAKRQAGIKSEVRVARAAIGNMLKAIADVEGGLVGQEIGDPESSRHDEVESAGLFRDLSGEIGPKGASGEFGIGPDSVQCDEGVLDFRGEAEAVREKRFLELDINHLGAE